VLDLVVVDDCVQRADACVHLAARLGVTNVVAHPLASLRENVLGADVVMEAAARHERKLIFSSSSEVYGKLNQAGLRESDDRLIGPPSKSRWNYAISKEFGEALAQAYMQEANAEMVVVRLFNTVGPRQASSYGMVLPRFVRQAITGEPLTVYGNGMQTRCFTDVRDVVRALRKLLICDAAAGGVFNIGSSRSVRVLDLARLVIDRLASSSPIVLVPYERALPAGFEELGNRTPDTSALRELTGWTTQVGLERTIDAVVAHELDEALVQTLAKPRDAGSQSPATARAAA
jgi:UDP-glucose 4-epimerase